MALSNALPIKNSSDRSVFCQGEKVVYSIFLTIYPFLIRKGLPLLGPVPFDDEPVTEGQRCPRVGCSRLASDEIPFPESTFLQLIAVKEGARKGGFDVTDSFILYGHSAISS